MQIVIDIPEVFYEALRKTDEIISGQRSGKTLMSVIYNAVAQGTPLPKGHGRLIDEKDVIKIYDNDDRVWWENVIDDIKEFVPTIIEADKPESEE